MYVYVTATPVHTPDGATGVRGAHKPECAHTMKMPPGQDFATCGECVTEAMVNVTRLGYDPMRNFAYEVTFRLSKSLDPN